MQDKEYVKGYDQGYENGYDNVWVNILLQACRELGYKRGDNVTHEVERGAWIAERSQAIHALRGACAEYGDNDWDRNLQLSDILNKHLFSHLLDGKTKAASLSCAFPTEESGPSVKYPQGKISLYDDRSIIDHQEMSRDIDFIIDSLKIAFDVPDHSLLYEKLTKSDLPIMRLVSFQAASIDERSLMKEMITTVKVGGYAIIKSNEGEPK